jgi:hypothetical protein
LHYDPLTYSDPFGLRACDEDQVEIRDDCLDVLTGAPPLVTPSSALAGLARVGGVLSGGVRAARIVGQARTILGSAEMATLRSAAQAGASAEVQIAGHTIVYEHGLSASGMTLFGEKGFVLGRHAFSSAGELAKTVLHELYRLNTSSALTSGVGGATAAAETGAAAAFAERAYRIGSLLRFW